MKWFKQYIDNISIDTLFAIWVIDTFLFLLALLFFRLAFGVSIFELIINYYAYI